MYVCEEFKCKNRYINLRDLRLKLLKNKENNKKICDPASQNQQKVAWPSFVLWPEIGDQGQHG